MRSGSAPGAAQRGFTYFGALFLIVLMGAALAGTGLLWSTASRRAKEKELLWVGSQYAQALRRYYENSPDPKQYPQRLDELLEDNRRPTVHHHLRRLYPDPLTGTTDWGLILASDGRIVGVHSRATRPPLKRAHFPPRWAEFDGSASYADWLFVAERAFMTGVPAATPTAPANPATSPLLPAPASALPAAPASPR